MGQNRTNAIWAACAVAMAGLAAVASAGENDRGRQDAVRIGMVNSLFRDTPEPIVLKLMKPFCAMVETHTGLPGEMVIGGDAASLGQLLARDKVHLGVFHGIEFAWARQQHPELRPLVIAVNQKPILHAVLMIRADSPIQTVADLKGKTLAVSENTREHCHLYLERLCQELGQKPGHFFSKITTLANAELALDDLVEGGVQAVLVDGQALACYQRFKPYPFAKLKTLHRSEGFPAAVVAYHPGVLDEVTLKRFRDGMLNINKAAAGKQFLTLWRLTGFETIPADYDQVLANIVKFYPPPTAP